MRTLPDHYNDRSVYAHFPMMVPSRMRESLVYQGVADMYDWEMRSTAKVVKPIETAEGVRSVLKDWRTFKTGQVAGGTKVHLHPLTKSSRVRTVHGRYHGRVWDLPGLGRYTEASP